MILNEEFRLDENVLEQDTSADETWAISYGDMITLLLAFFTIFFSLDEGKNPVKKNMIQFEMNSVLIKKINESNIAKVIDVKKMGIDEQLLKDTKALAHENGNQLVIEFPNVSFFNSAETELTTKGQWALFQFMKEYLPYAGNYSLSIRAYTDNRPIIQKANLRFKDNLELSSLRSIATMRFLQKQGIPLNKMRTAGFGEMQLTAELLDKSHSETEKTKILDFSRKVILVIEPEEKI